MNPNLINLQLNDLVPKSPKWEELLQNTSPGNDGTLDSNIIVDKLYVNINARTLKFYDAKFYGEVQFGGSGNDGFPVKFSTSISGEGKFEFEDDNQNVKITDLSFDKDSIDLFP